MLNVSTKTGDEGKTSLANGKRLAKDNVIFEIVGTLDELNSHLGLVVSKLNSLPKNNFESQLKMLNTIQKQLFVLGSYASKADVELSDDFLKKIEKESEKIQLSMDDDWHNCFVLPGGHEIAAQVDIARSVCRRLERSCAGYVEQSKSIDPLLLKTINRLSDYLYVLRCFINEELGVVEHYI
jgi:cob(I)alamin adenosyltransferase